jgi:hypothetical protein
VDIVWGFDAGTQQWRRHIPSGTGNTLETMESGAGYWIHMTGDGLFTMETWGPPSSTVSLSQGWNLLGYAGTDGVPVATSLSELTGMWSLAWNWTEGVWYLNSEIPIILPPGIQPLSVFHRGKAYWIKINPGQAGEWVQ